MAEFERLYKNYKRLTNPAAASTSATIVIHMAYSFLFVLKVFQQSLPRLCFLSSVIDCLSSRTGAT